MQYSLLLDGWVEWVGRVFYSLLAQKKFIFSNYALNIAAHEWWVVLTIKSKVFPKWGWNVNAGRWEDHSGSLKCA